jgi:hypothetical protein
MAPCFGCGTVFSFNPHKVPSMRDPRLPFDDSNPKQPVCQNCMNRVNRQRAEIGLKPHPIAKDAYEAIDESEL